MSAPDTRPQRTLVQRSDHAELREAYALQYGDVVSREVLTYTAGVEVGS